VVAGSVTGGGAPSEEAAGPTTLDPRAESAS
jgi:hypothetical protein